MYSSCLRTLLTLSRYTLRSFLPSRNLFVFSNFITAPFEVNFFSSVTETLDSLISLLWFWRTQGLRTGRAREGVTTNTTVLAWSSLSWMDTASEKSRRLTVAVFSCILLRRRFLPNSFVDVERRRFQFNFTVSFFGRWNKASTLIAGYRSMRPWVWEQGCS